jgi:hypothetical protein
VFGVTPLPPYLRGKAPVANVYRQNRLQDRPKCCGERKSLALLGFQLLLTPNCFRKYMSLCVMHRSMDRLPSHTHVSVHPSVGCHQVHKYLSTAAFGKSSSLRTEKSAWKKLTYFAHGFCPVIRQYVKCIIFCELI